MTERSGIITFHGNGLTLLGEELKTGAKAPAATLLGNDLSPKSLDDFTADKRIVVTVPSLDTPVCSLESQTFNEKAAGLAGVDVIVVSMDLPFAQARWVEEHKAQNIHTLSDHKDAELGQAWGLVIKELRLLARAVYVLEKDGTVSYVEIVPEVTDEPAYDAVLKAVGA